jgi:hypothetical protein
MLREVRKPFASQPPSELHDLPDALEWLSSPTNLLTDLRRFRGIGPTALSQSSELASDPEYQSELKRLRKVLHRLATLGCSVHVVPTQLVEKYGTSERLRVRVPEPLQEDVTELFVALLELRISPTDRIVRVDPRTYEVQYSLRQETPPEHAEWCEPD